MIIRRLMLCAYSLIVAAFVCNNALAQPSRLLVRLAQIEVDSASLPDYKAMLQEEIEASIRLEPGVLTLNAVSEQANPTRLTILEIYADSAAYKSHLQTPHFTKYKTGTQHMVKSLELIPTDPIMLGMKKDIVEIIKKQQR